MKWEEIEYFGALDWAKDHHDIVLVNRQAEVLLHLRIEHDVEGWNRLRERLHEFPKVAIAIETNVGPAVEQLLDIGVPVFPVNPISASRYRDRKKPSQVKTDFVDAWALADALRVDGHAWKQLLPADPLTVELRQLCRDEMALIEQRTALLNQLHYALSNYYPQITKAFDIRISPQAWAFVESFPTPELARKAGKRRLQNWMHGRKLWFAEKTEERIEILLSEGLKASLPTVRAKSLLAVSVAKMLRTLQQQIDQYRKRIGELFSNHPDHDLFGSLPGAGTKIAPRLLSEIGADRTRFEDPQALQCHAGTAPAFFQSGQIQRVHIRRARNLFLRNAIHHLADRSRRTVPGLKPITKRTRRKASHTPAPSAAWASAGSRSFSRCGNPTLAITPTFTSATKLNMDLG